MQRFKRGVSRRKERRDPFKTTNEAESVSQINQRTFQESVRQRAFDCVQQSLLFGGGRPSGEDILLVTRSTHLSVCVQYVCNGVGT